jgi:hypothetical protein
MQHREHGNRLFRRTEIGCVGKSVQQCATDVAGDNGKLLRLFANPSENLIDGAKEAGAEARLLIVVPSGSVLEIGFGKRSNDEPAPHPIYGL